MPTIAKDLTIDLQEDRPGMLARAAEAIASGGLNLEGFAEIEGILHVLTSDPRSARLALEAVGLSVLAEQAVVVTQVENRAGSVAAVFERLAQAGINVRYTYVASGNRVVLAAEDPRKALAALSGKGVEG
jgi:hypothetical protein